MTGPNLPLSELLSYILYLFVFFIYSNNILRDNGVSGFVIKSPIAQQHRLNTREGPSSLMRVKLQQRNTNRYADKRSRLSMSYALSFGRGRVALVTGAGRGLGKCMAETLGKTGISHVICVDRTAEACAEVVRNIQNYRDDKGEGCDASGYGVDVSDAKAVSVLTNTLLDVFGHIDILVNNAGITKDNLFLRMKEREWLDVINVNLNSAFYFSSPIVRRMLKNRFGRIINMSSVVGVGGNPGQSNYAASKAGLIGLTKSLSKEVASRNITVNAIAPGMIKTLMTDAMTDEAKKTALSWIPAGRMGQPEEVAALAVFLASDNAGYITGKVIPIDGGMLFGGN